jgi:acyl phosphate:glycerol-3-phosphate acyltransferase
VPGLAELVAAIGGYLVGAIPSGVLIGRMRGVDPRGAGSGRTGTTNALRTLGPGLAGLVLVLDVAKGAGAVAGAAWLADRLGSSDAWPMAIAGIAAVVGHVRSVFIRFGGGRGVATGGGAMLLLAPFAIVAVVPAFSLVVWRTRYVSLGSITAAVVLPIAVAVLYSVGQADGAALVAAAAIGVVVVAAHADNIARLRAGTERRLGHG